MKSVFCVIPLITKCNNIILSKTFIFSLPTIQLKFYHICIVKGDQTAGRDSNCTYIAPRFTVKVHRHLAISTVQLSSIAQYNTIQYRANQSVIIFSSKGGMEWGSQGKCWGKTMPTWPSNIIYRQCAASTYSNIVRHCVRITHKL